MTLENWQFIFSLTGMGLMATTVLSQITLRLTLDRRVRKALPANKIYDGFFDGFFGLLRASLFGNACISFINGSKKNMEIFYDGFDVANFANSFEKTMSYVHLISACIVVLYIPIFLITKWLGIFEW